MARRRLELRTLGLLPRRPSGASPRSTTMARICWRTFGPVPAVWTAIRVACMLALTCYGWLLFRAGSLHQVLNMTQSLINPISGLDVVSLRRIVLIVAPLLVVQFVQWRSGELYFGRLAWLPAPLKVVGYSLMLYSILFLGGTPQSFVYFQF